MGAARRRIYSEGELRCDSDGGPRGYVAAPVFGRASLSHAMRGLADWAAARELERAWWWRQLGVWPCEVRAWAVTLPLLGGTPR